MARCSCDQQGECSCAVAGRNGITVTGSGAEGTPTNISFDPGTGAAAGCERIMDCVGSNLGVGLAYSDADNQIRALMSTDANNVASIGTDHGLMVIGATALDPPGYAYGTTADVTITASLEDMILHPQIEGSSAGDVTLSGNSLIVHRPGVWFFQAQFRYDTDFDYTVEPPTGIVYGRISGTGRGRQQGQVVSRDSAYYGMDYTVMMPFTEATTSVEFYVQRSSVGWTAMPVANCWWSCFRLGDIP